MQQNAAGAPASPQQFCLRWNNYQTNLTNVFDQLLQSESFVDVTLACEGHSVKAHKMVLSACSPYFQSLFFDNPCQHPIVILKDIKWPELKAVVEFMYRGEINVSQEQIGPLLKVAESLKIRGLADVNGETDLGKEDVSLSRQKKRRRTSGEAGSSPEGSLADPLEGRAPLELVTTSPTLHCPPPASQASMLPLPLPPPPPPPPPSAPPVPTPTQDDMEIKPGIAEMIREEERAKMLESSHAWFGASTSSLAADSYQYQLQSMWQKCWNTNQSLVHNLRFRERGPLKSWRPETMAEAILSVLKEGLSLSQAARKYDIPYPTFVLYANRVHNMLGPSADGGTDLRPKGRGRPQRILLGIWPEEHIRGVIRAVVFRDPQHIKEEALNLGYPRMPHMTTYANSAPAGAGGGGGGPGSGAQGPPGGGQVPPGSGGQVPPGSGGQVPQGGGGTGGSDACSGGGGVSPNSGAAAVVALAQGLRQQMLAAAVHHHNHQDFGFLAAHCGGNGTNLMLHSPLPSPVDSSPRSSPLAPNNNIEAGMGMGYKPVVNDNIQTARADHLFQDDIEDLVKRPQPNNTPKMKPNMGFKPIGNDLTSPRGEHMFQEEMEGLMKRPQAPDTPKVKVGIGVSGMPYKSGGCEGYVTPRPDALFQEEIENLVKSPQQQAPKDMPHMPAVDQRTE